MNILKFDFSKGNEAFCEDLLTRCLREVDANNGRLLDDDVLDMLSAAGNPNESVLTFDGEGYHA